jgi:tyrosine-specific transport protein
MEKKRNPLGMQLSIALLVTGNLIGAGILGIPVIAGLCGVGPALLGMVVFCLAMYYTACVLADETIAARSETFNYPSLYHRYLGNAGKWIAAAANMLILYGLLTAYLAGGSAILAQILGLRSTAGVGIAFFAAMTLLTVAGMALIRRCNAGLVAALWASFAVIVALGALHVSPERYAFVHWPFLPVAIPVVVTAFHFHNIIPNVAEALAYDRRSIRVAMLVGMVIGFSMNAIWLLVGAGVVPVFGPVDSLMDCYAHNVPATIPMASLIGSKYFMVFAMVFSVIAIVTSYVANGLGLMGFCRDLSENYLHVKSRALVVAATFLPPFAISILNPEIFLKAINFVGGYGIVVLFGILPAIIALIRPGQSRAGRTLATAMLALFGLVLLFQLGMDLHLLRAPLPTEP